MHAAANCRVRNKRPCGVTTAEGTCNEWHHQSLQVSRFDYWHAEASIKSLSYWDMEQEQREAAEKGGGQEGCSAASNRNWPDYHKNLCLSRSDYCQAEANTGGMSSRDEEKERKEAAEKGSGNFFWTKGQQSRLQRSK